MIKQIVQAALKSPADVPLWNVMTAFADTLTHPGSCLRGTGQPEVVQLNVVPESQGAKKNLDVGFAAQSGFQCEGLLSEKGCLYFLEQ